MTATRTKAEAKTSSCPASPGHFKFPHNFDIEAIKPSHLKMFVIFERCCPFTSYCWHSNATLAKKYGCSVRQIANILHEMQEAGYIWRLAVNPEGFRRRDGIFLHVRLDPDRPTEDRPPPQEAIDRLWAARKRSRSAPAPTSPREEKFLPAREEKFLPAREEKFLPSNKESLSLNKEQLEEPGRSLDQRQRKDSQAAKAIHPVPAQPTPAAAHPLIDKAESRRAGQLGRLELPGAVVAADAPPATSARPLAPGQVEFLASLDADQRAAFDAWPVAKQAEALAPHRLGFDRVIAGDAIRRLSPPPAPPPPVPRTTAEFLAGLPEAPPTWSGLAAQALNLDFGVKNNSRLWGQFRLIAEAIRLGRIDPAHAINAHRQAMETGIKNPGAKFWAALQDLAELDPHDLKELAAPP